MVGLGFSFLVPWGFLVGTALGSFLNVCILRLPAGRSILYPASHCPRCKRSIAWFDNIPVLSFIFLRGKCRNCGLAISLQYPAVEVLTGLLFVLAFWRFGEEPIRLIWVLALLLISVLLSAIDIRTLTLPDKILLPFGALCLLLAPLNPNFAGTIPEHYKESLWGFFFGGGILWTLSVVGFYLLKKEALGGGDVKLMAVFGSALGWDRVMDGLFTGSLASFFMVLVLMGLGRLGMKSPFPFGPFLCAGTLASFFWPQAGFLYWLRIN
jgi:leader peptidase (prepilin peptidase)/N-methyltransferase